ncbi:MAG TPA: serpin family protein [Xanthobacteraceae bacterium]|nr:serpin family protein [Xanthobacteraceae bacterium]
MRLALIAAVVLALVHAMSVPSTAQPLSPERVLGAQMRLSANLAAEMAKQPRNDPNIVISPASVAGVMALIDIGADMKMRGAIWDTLGFKPALGHDAASDLAALRATITQAPEKQADDTKFDLANVVMFDPQAKPYDKAMKEMRATGAEVSTAPLSDVENIRRINRWVAGKTQNLIPGILAEQPLPPGLVAVNALYFKGLWPRSFSKDLTRPQTFHMVAGETQVPMMHAQERYNFKRDGDFAAIEMPYRGGRFAMVVLTNTARSLQLQDFAPVAGWLNGSGFTSREVSLSLPRFTLEASEELLEPLKALGLKHGMDSVTAFENLAMLPQEISRIVQKTFMKVDEEGTEAAAATGVIMETASLKPREPERLVVDRPFLFALRDRESGLILMSGYIARPATGPAASLGEPKKFASETPNSPRKE